ncbi:hypothetical protein W1080910_093 [Cyanophage S-RIM12 isolate W1_08_0910]|uniref:Uncharacterized protein n=4 Tax=Brizovirus TaxID=2733098 RepID=A0A1D7SQS2_9CAUD|nr:hypothetical protein HOQ64_gp143 [Cyanophage S-RIM12 isolate RW_01_0310]YP_009779287.1 hypothetical protein HOQ65_gp143 [Cyanophage S-RIM12 isolate RW_06_0310]YP_009779502.1 hypothetical protein HOQ66_gp143 [Cyanophage S-RIM12 isolate W1_08_0910]AOO15366.1 hypothetical protein Np150310_092 [Cyanophage S-RIM12_Np_15_0310]AOO16006.1 hypothetical protein RW040310_092 [Cyanophage S-RIM12_RW_04_0310]AOO18155.1 hypothetical protein Sn070910_090 [Cyanophage S-RIM12_Sn_07_0910]AOO18368.1 hypotheti
MSHIPVKNKDNWYRNSETGSVLCSDSDTYQKYMTAYKADKQKEEDFTTLQNEVSELKSDLGDIKSLLLTLVQSKENKL